MADTKKFNCPRCGWGFDLKANLTSHLNNKKLCEAKVFDISREEALKLYENERKLPTINCEYCNKLITLKSRQRHFLTCTKYVLEDVPHEQIVDNRNVEEQPNLNALVVLLKNKDDELTQLRRELAVVRRDNEILRTQQSGTNHRQKHAKDKITPAVKYACWDKYVGKDKGTTMCLCCKRIEISQITFDCGHVIARSDGGTLAIDNLRPICHKCNNSMGTMNMNEFIAQHGF